MAELSPNRTVGGKYSLLKKIAVGGMAEIYLAEQSGPGGFKKRLVIKRILEHLMGDVKFRHMFQDEARLAAGLNHPNIVQIFELGEDNGTYYIAMEYVHGYNLRSLIQTCNTYGMWLAPEYIAKLGSQICEGLEYAHNFCDSDGKHLNIIHRDISPQNIILSNQGVIKLVDFGIAKAASNKVETQAGVIKGKLAYMSPEQVKGQKLDRRSDLFSLGIVLYELATHKRPFQGKSDLDILRAILEAKPTDLQAIRPDFPAELSTIIYRSLAKNREERYSSSRDLQWDLERFIQSWGKPIGPFQLQQLVGKLEELSDTPSTKAETPPKTQQPKPAPPVAPPVAQTPPPAPPLPTANNTGGSYAFEDDDLEEDTIYSPKARQNQFNPRDTIQNFGDNPNNASPYQQNAQRAPYPPSEEQKGWFGAPADEWDDDDGDRTVMNPSPVMSPNDFRRLAEQARKPEDIATVHEGSADLDQINKALEEHNKRMQSDNINEYLKPPPQRTESGPATMLDSNISGILPPGPNGNPLTMLDRPTPVVPPASYVSAPQRNAERPTPTSNRMKGIDLQRKDRPQTTQSGQQTQGEGKGKWWIWVVLGLFIALAAGGATFFFVFK